jgi:hypothetical protein
VVRSRSTVTVRVHLEYLEAVEESNLILVLRQQEKPQQTENLFCGPNLGYALDLYESFRENPESVDERTREFFKSWSPPRVETNGHTQAVARKLFWFSTNLKGIFLKEMQKGERVVVDFTFDVPLPRGFYDVSVSVSERTGAESFLLDKIDAATTFRIKWLRDRSHSRGLVRVPTKIQTHTPEGEQQDQSA